MITYFPEIYPDELVYSWFCRYYVHAGCFTHKMALNELLYKRCNNPSKEFIGHLNSDAESIISRMYDIDKFILNHTMFPQYARFIPLKEKKNALYKLGHEFCDAHHLFSILPRKEGEYYLRYCPLCAAEDREKYGETYWHRKHQIRNMTVCTKHRCKLFESDVTAKSEQTFTLCDAESHIKDRKAVIESDLLAFEFAKYMAAVFDTSIDFRNEVPLSSVLYHALAKTKYMKSSGKSRYTKMLAEDIKEYYQKIGLPNIPSIYQIQRTLLGSRFDFSVVCQIAFFIGMSVEELTKPILTDEQIEHEQSSHYIKNSTPIDWVQLDEKIAPLLEKVARDIYLGIINKNSRPERVSEKLLYREMDLSAHRLESMPKCRAIFEKYIESYPESYARKIIWAYHKLQAESDKPFYWSDIRKLSGVKKKNFNEVIPYLEKHSDIITTKAIINLVIGRKNAQSEIQHEYKDRKKENTF